MFDLSEVSFLVEVIVVVVCDGLVLPGLGLTMCFQVVTTSAHAYIVNSFCLNWYKFTNER